MVRIRVYLIAAIFGVIIVMANFRGLLEYDWRTASNTHARYLTFISA
jgi:hypothetical protein